MCLSLEIMHPLKLTPSTRGRDGVVTLAHPDRSILRRWEPTVQI